jgi:transglutaminase-like putative cysteine protease
MKRHLLVYCLALLGTAPAGASPLDGDWFILTGRNSVVSSNPQHDALKEVAKWAKDNAEVKYLVFAPDGSWFLQFNNGAWGAGALGSLFKKLDELGKARRGLKGVAFMAQGGMVVVDDRNEIATDGIPAGTRARLRQAQQQVRQKGGTIRSVAFAPDGGWVLLFDKGFVAEGLPGDLSRQLAEHDRKHIPVRCVAFTSQGDWFLLDGGNACFSSNPAHPAFKKLNELRAQGQSLRWLAFTAGEYRQGYRLEHQPVKRIRAVLTLHIDEPAGGVEEWTVYAPRAPELGRQRDVKTTLVPPGEPVKAGLPERTLLRGRVTGQPRGIEVQVVYEMTLYRCRLLPRLRGDRPARAALDPKRVAEYTRATAGEDFDAKPFQQFLDRAGLRRGPKEGDLSFARRAYRYLRHHFEYSTQDMDKRASNVCRVGKSDCGGLSCLLIAVLRANGVPARMLLGRLAVSEVPPKTKGQGTNTQTHAKSEFFARGVGWVPVDMTFSDGTEFGYFGNDPAYFVTMDLDVEMSVPTFAVGPVKLGGLQGMAWWRRGGSGQGERVGEQHWKVETLDLPRDTAAAEAEGEDTDSPPVVAWLLLGLLLAAPLLGVGLLVGKRRRVPRANPSPTPPPRRCGHCRRAVQVLSVQAGQWFKCPGCGTVQQVGG